MAKPKVVGQRLDVIPSKLREGDPLLILGTGFSKGTHRITVDRKPLPVTAAGPAFTLPLELPLLAPGTHTIQVDEARARFTVRARTVTSKAWQRMREEFLRRFEHIGFVPSDFKESQFREVDRLRKYRDDLKDRLLKTPVGELPKLEHHGHGGFPLHEAKCLHRLSWSRWTPLGPAPVPDAPTWSAFGQAWSGRILCIAIAPVADPNDDRTIYAGAASGGIWKSTDSGRTWDSKSDGLPSLSVGSLAIDPNNPDHIIAGTGELALSGLYAVGLYRSTNGGNSWTHIPRQTGFQPWAIMRILFDPTDAESKRMFIASGGGLYSSLDGGLTWNLIRAGVVTDALIIVVDAGPPPKVQLVAGFRGQQIWTNTATLGPDGWQWQFAIGTVMPSDFPTEVRRIALAQCRDQPRCMYASIEVPGEGVIVMKSSYDGTQWRTISPPFKNPFAIESSSPAYLQPAEEPDIHRHWVTIPETSLQGPFSGIEEFTTAGAHNSAGTVDGHTHGVRISAADRELLAKGIPVLDKTTTEVNGHVHTFDLCRGAGRQCWYNNVIAVHPTKPDTVYFGGVDLWKTETGDAPWTMITDGEPAAPVTNRSVGTHQDQHAIVFDPADPSIIWLGNDGGVWVSTDEGRIWTDANRNLATLQYNHITSHPRFDAVLLGGTQDNGTHRYLSHPGWEWVEGGDGGFSVIDQKEPSRMYHGFYFVGFSRSDEAGSRNTWTAKSGPKEPSLFYPPFRLDPVATTVCYFGTEQLWRSDDRGEPGSWRTITDVDDIEGLISSICVDPFSRQTIYIGTTFGRVYRVRRIGATWDRAAGDVVVRPLVGGEDLTWRRISSISVDAYGHVWITTSAVPTDEWDGVFESNAYVFMFRSWEEDWGFLPRGWVSRSNGLPPGNPIHTLLIDPRDEEPKTLYCGGDIGVFRTDDGGDCWLPWDEGLPNSPVYHLDLHDPTRLLRAATYGRSVWERPVDAWLTSDADVYVRDNVLDTGRVRPSPSDEIHPFDPNTSVYWWQSPDIKVDAADPEFQTADPVNEYIGFEALTDETGKRDALHRVYVQVHNRGPYDANRVKVRVFASPLQYAPLPEQFWSNGSPFDADPPASDWVPVGPTALLERPLQPAEPAVVHWDWRAGRGTYSFLALVTSEENPIRAADVFDIETLVRLRKHAALKNVVVTGEIERPKFIKDYYFPERSIHVIPRDFRIDFGNLPRGTSIRIEVQKKAYTVERGRERIAIVPAVATPAGKKFPITVTVSLPKIKKNVKELRFDVMHESGKDWSGTTYIVRARSAHR